MEVVLITDFTQKCSVPLLCVVVVGRVVVFSVVVVVVVDFVVDVSTWRGDGLSFGYFFKEVYVLTTIV